MASIFLRDGVWYLRWRDGIGRLKRRASHAKTKREAQALLDELVGQAQRVKLGLESAPVESRLTLRQLLEWWRTERCPEPSREMARMQLGKHVLKGELADYPLPALTADLLETKVLERMEKAGSSAATVNRLRGMLHAAFEAAIQPPRRWSGRNPVAETRSRTVHRKDFPTLTPDQVARVLEQVPEQWRGVMATAAYLGLRRGEIFGLKKSDYDREHQTLRVAASHQRDTTKSGRRDTLPVPGILRPYLERARRTPGFWLFPDGDGQQRTREADPHLVLRRACGRIGLAQSWCSYCLTCERAGRPNRQVSKTAPDRARCPVDKRWRRVRVEEPLPIRFHDLRHSCATNLLKAGVPLAHVARILRHSSIRVTNDVYGHLGTEDLRSAVDAPSQSSQPALTRRTQSEHGKEVPH